MGGKGKEIYLGKGKTFSLTSLFFCCLNLTWIKKWLSATKTKWKLSFWVKWDDAVDWRWIFTPFYHYSGKNVSGQHRSAPVYFPNELKNPLHSQLYLQYLCYSAPEVPYGAVSETQDRKQIKLLFCFVSFVPWSHRGNCEPHLTAELNLPLDPIYEF